MHIYTNMHAIAKSRKRSYNFEWVTENIYERVLRDEREERIVITILKSHK